MGNKLEKLLRDSRTPQWKLVKLFILTLLAKVRKSQLKKLNKNQLKTPKRKKKKRRKKIRRRNERLDQIENIVKFGNNEDPQNIYIVFFSGLN